MLQVIRFSAVLQCTTASSSASTTFVFALLFQCNSYLCTRCITRITSSKDLSLSLRVIALQCNSVNNAWAGICICTANDASWVLQAGMTWLFELCHHQCPASNTDALNTLRTKHPLFCIKTIGYFSPSNRSILGIIYQDVEGLLVCGHDTVLIANQDGGGSQRVATGSPLMHSPQWAWRGGGAEWVANFGVKFFGPRMLPYINVYRVVIAIKHQAVVSGWPEAQPLMHNIP